MLLILLLIVPVASEWVEISQQHYVRPVKVTYKPSLKDTVDQVVKRKGYEQLNSVGKLSEPTARSNRIYINHTIAYSDWEDIFEVSAKPVLQTGHTKVTIKPINDFDEQGTVPFQNGIKNQVLASKDKNFVKNNKTIDNRVSLNGNKVVVMKDSKPKPFNTEKPNRIYLGDEYSGSFEVLEWADLDKLAEEDSKKFFKNHITPDYKLHPQTQHKHTPSETNTQHQEIHSESNQKVSEQPHNLQNSDTTKTVSMEKSDNTYINNKQNKLKLSPGKPVTIIQKHMVAKITQVSEPNKTRTSTEEYGNEKQKDNLTTSETDTNADTDKFSNHNMNATNINHANSVNNNHKSMNSKPTVVKNRYETRGSVKNDKVPDPEEIMIQELLAENDESNDLDATADDGVRGDNIENDVVEKQSETENANPQVNEKGTKAPDPDEVMIKEILNAEITKSGNKIPKVPPHNGSVQTLKTSTQRVTITTAKQNLKKNNSVKFSDYSTKEQSPVKIPIVGVDYQKVNNIVSAPTVDDKKENKMSLEIVSVLTTLKPQFPENPEIQKNVEDKNENQVIQEKMTVLAKPLPSPQIQKATIKIDNGQNEFDDRHLEKIEGMTTTEYESVETTTTEVGSIEVESKESYYKSKMWLRGPAPEFVSKEEFFTESEELVNLNIKDDNIPSTLEPVSINNNDFSHTEDKTSTSDAIGSSYESHKISDSPKPDNEINGEKAKGKEAPNRKKKKDNTMQNVVKLLKVVTDIIARNTQRSFGSKVRYLEDLKDTLLSNIQHRLEAAFPPTPPSGRRARSPPAGSRSLPAEARSPPDEPRSLPAPVPRGHVDFPSSESALMTISFLTFAVFLIKLVLQVIQSYKSKSSVPTVVAAVGRAGVWRRQR